MGLDNGIMLRFKGDIDPPKYVKIERALSIEPEWEICYWRKCEGLRRKILDVIPGSCDDEFVYDIGQHTIQKIQDVIYEQLKNPEDWNSRIWDFDEVVHVLSQDIVNLSWLLDFIKEEPHATVYFYDSY